MNAISIRVEDIEVGERHRALSSDAVARLAGSLKEIGLQQPITIRVVEEMVLDGQLTAGVPFLVAGRHRLEAAKSLGWSHIDCIEMDDDALKAELWEIAENLHRCDLTKEQRDEHIRRYVELIEAQRIVAQNGEQSPRPIGRPKSAIQQAADNTGLSRETVRRALKPKPAAEVFPIAVRSEQDAVIAQTNAIVAAWNRACPEAREAALDQIDTPTFDRTRAGAA